MASTVIASFRHSFYLTPWRVTSVSEASLDALLARYGLERLAHDRAGLEFIVAEGMDPLTADELAGELRGLGLRCRVRSMDGMALSNPVSLALMANLYLAAGALLFGIGSLSYGFDASPPLWSLVVAGLLAPVALFSLRNVVSIIRNGSNRLRHFAAPATSELALAILGIRGALPEHLSQPLVARARSLDREVQRHPSGPAAAELAALVAELQGLEQQSGIADVRSFAKELRQAQEAVAEARAPRSRGPGEHKVMKAPLRP